MSETHQAQIMCVRITGPERQVRGFLRDHPHPTEAARREGDSVTIEVFVDEALLGEIERRHLKAEVLYDASARGRERQKEVGQGNRFEGERRIPRGLGLEREEESR
jgi:hypothetical protein